MLLAEGGICTMMKSVIAGLTTGPARDLGPRGIAKVERGLAKGKKLPS